MLERSDLAFPLLSKLNKQAEGQPVEILCLIDNRKQPLAAKRNALLAMSQGRYVAHVDDDDDVSDDYMDSLVQAIREQPNVDVICFEQQCNVQGQDAFVVQTDLSFANEWNQPGHPFRSVIKRKPWHWCAWMGSLARRYQYETSGYGEDVSWLKYMWAQAKTQSRLSKVLHYYRWSSGVTAFKTTP